MKRPPGLRSASSGTFRLILSKSSMVSLTPASRATARRCRTALVEPPVVATAAIAFSNDFLVRICFGRRSFWSNAITIWPQRKAISSFLGSIAGTPLNPSGEMPRNSKAMAIVLAVNWPPHAPGPGQA